MMLAALSVNALNTAEAVLISVGVILCAVVAARLTSGRRWSAALALPPVVSERFTILDAIVPFLVSTGLTYWCYQRFAPAGAEMSGTTQPATPDARALAIAGSAGQLAAVVLMLGLAKLRVSGGLGGWGLSTTRPAGTLGHAVIAYVALWPICAGLLWVSRTLVPIVAPGYQVTEHQTLWLLRGTIDTAPGIAAVLILGAALLAPVMEELLFRGIILPLCARVARNSWVGIVASALFFASIHANVETIPPLFALGMILGYAYVRSGSLTLVILIHVVFNTKTILTLMLGAAEITR